MPGDAERRPTSFDDVADDYDRYRPPYPGAVVDALVATCGIGPGRDVLEIGCGTGQLTADLARRGARLTAVEPGVHLAARARRNLAALGDVRVEEATFEAWDPVGRTFDAVVCASAFHWLDPATRFDRVAALLVPGGALGVVHVHHVRGGTPGFFAATQPVYDRWGLGTAPGFELAAPDAVGPSYPDLDTHPAFERVERRFVEWPRRLTTEAYVGWLRTDSLVNTLTGADRDAFLAAIGRLVDEHGGTVERNFTHEIVSARRVRREVSGRRRAGPAGGTGPGDA